jgi:hypothetical protein
MAGTVIIETNLIAPEIAMYLSFMYLFQTTPFTVSKEIKSELGNFIRELETLTVM